MVDAVEWFSAFRDLTTSDALARRGAVFVDANGQDWAVAPIRSNASMLCPEVDIANAPTVRLLFPPRMEKLSVSQDFYAVSFTAALPAGVGSAVDICEFQLADGMIGFLQFMSMYILAPAAADQVAWELRIGNGPVSGFSDRRNPPMAAAALYLPLEDLQIRVGISQRVSLRARNIGGTAVTVGGEIGGWYHPETAEAVAWGLRL